MVYGDWLPRQILGKFTAFCAVLRMIYLTIVVLLFYRSHTDVIVLDGVSAPVPLLRWFGLKVLFYCHFPDLVSFRLDVERAVYILLASNSYFVQKERVLSNVCIAPVLTKWRNSLQLKPILFWLIQVIFQVVTLFGDF